jgi:transcriptional antiterminator NusG
MTTKRGVIKNMQLGMGVTKIDWYVVRTISGKEDEVCIIFQKIFSEFEIVYPKRRVGWRKKGHVISVIRPLFEGYLFVSTNKIETFHNLLRKHAINNAWLTRCGENLMPIYPEEKNLIQQLIGNEGIVEVSEIQMVDNQIKVVKGPLIGLEHVIKKYSGKNRRIVIEFSVLGEKREVELEGSIVNLGENS